MYYDVSEHVAHALYSVFVVLESLALVERPKLEYRWKKMSLSFRE